jgi:hypothetical protein
MSPPDYDSIKRYLRSIEQREALGQFIKAGWAPAELAEYARQTYLVPGQTKPTAASYQFVVERGPAGTLAKQFLEFLRAPGYVIQPFDRPVPKRFEWDAPDNPEHTPEIRSDVEIVGRLYRDRRADRLGRPRPAGDEPVPRWVWKRAYRLRNRYHSLEDTLDIQKLREPPAVEPSDDVAHQAENDD